MKWIVIASFMVYLAAFSEGSALRCSRGTDNDCHTDNTEKEAESNVDSKKPECLAGSEWESLCHTCRCSEDGQPECARLGSCRDETKSEPMVCRPLTEFRRDCNICICLESGLGSSCTSMECAPKTDISNGKECKVGTKWQSQCNNCSCSDDGMPMCTDMACPGQEEEPEMLCALGTSWKLDCNTCYCPPTGRAACTRIGCGLYPVTDFNPDNGDDDAPKPENIYSHNRIKRSRVCKPNTIYKVECNSCKCASDGQSYSCTLNECTDDADFSADINEDVEVFIEKDTKDMEQVCKPRRTFHIGCNTCLCTVDGTDFSCTNKPCPLPDDVEIFKEIKDLKHIIP